MAESKIISTGFYAWFQKYYLHLINALLIIFIIGSILAPVLMRVGMPAPSKILYLFYGRFCHQLAFRSWFLFGEQAFYPLENQNKTLDALTYEEMFGAAPDDLISARTLLGSDQAGYKIAICQRDFAIYSSLLLFGFFFMMKKKRISRIPLILWVVCGFLPLGLDGLLQFISKAIQINGHPWIYESKPILRTLTGALFGFLSGWYLLPSIEQSFKIAPNKPMAEKTKEY